MATSGILTVVIFAFTLVTQEFVDALTFISPEAHQMLGVGQREHRLDAVMVTW